jgi:hypothetical protein
VDTFLEASNEIYLLTRHLYLHLLKDLQKQASLNQIGELSGHSFRVGAALDLLDKNIPLEKIMLRGGWKSETSAMRYLQSWNDQDWLIVASHHS